MASILLVEDHADSAEILSLGLSMHAHEVTIAHNVAAALKIVEDNRRFDVLLSDLSLPDGSGFSLLHGLRQRGVESIAIAMSGYGSPQDIARCQKAGFHSHLTKPVTSEEIDQAISQLLPKPA